MPAPLKKIPTTIFQRFFRTETLGGLILLGFGLAALAIANSPLSSAYNHLWEIPLTLGIVPRELSLSLHDWINDGLMAVFFLMVGLEIKRELLVGELSSTKRAVLPAIAALGGMIVPAMIYAALNWHDPDALRGWAIPAATDIAFALGVVAILGSRVPTSLKVFLTALAILDDLGAIAIVTLRDNCILDRAPEREASDPLRGPVRRDLSAAHSPYFLGVALEECIEKSSSELVAHPILEIARVGHGKKPRLEPGDKAKRRLEKT